MREIFIRRENFGHIAFYKDERRYEFVTHSNQLTIDPNNFLVGDNNIQYIYKKSIACPQQNAFISAPLAAYIEINHHCNMGCKHCFKSMIGYSKYLTKNEWLKLIDQFEKLGVFEVRFVGFEPTASPDLFECAEYARNKGMYIVLNTNGFMSDKKQDQVVRFGFDEFLISLDGNEEFHDHLRITGSYSRVLALLQKIKKYHIRTKINMTVSKLNIQYIDTVASIANEYGVNMNVIPMRMIGSGEKKSKESVALDPTHMYMVAEKIAILRKVYPNITIYLTYHDIIDSSATQYHQASQNYPCPAAKNINIQANGQVYPCDLMSHLGDEFCIGNVFENTLEDLWHKSPRIEKFRNLEKSKKCKTCEYFMHLCSGGCFIERYLYNGQRYEDPLCYKHLLSNELDEEPLMITDRGLFYDRSYYMDGIKTKKSLYENYHYIPKRSDSDYNAISNLFDLKIDAIRRSGAIVDFGSGFGFLVHTFLENGFDAYGIEISSFAKSCSFHSERIFYNLKQLPNIKYQLLIALSVFEHMTPNEIISVFEFARDNNSNMVFTVPLSYYEGGEYINRVFDKDKSHILRRPAQWWINIAKQYYKNIEYTDSNNYLFHSKQGMGLFCCKL